MAGRRSVWSDPRLVALAEHFVPAADEVWRLQRGKDAECLFFQRTVNKGQPITDGGTRQGIWVCSPGGVLLSHINSTRADDVLATLERGLAAWDELDEEQRHIPPGVSPDRGHRWEHSEPEDGLVLERIVRELRVEPAGENESEDAAGVEARSAASKRPPSWNRDFAWFSHDEIASLLPSDARVGEVHELPSFFARRLARFHLVDNARGQTLPYAPEEVLEARLQVRVVAREGSLLDLRLEGATRAVAQGPWLLGENLWRPKSEYPRGIETHIRGRATLDLEAGSFPDLELVALAHRWGRTTFNGRGRDASPGLLAFYLSLAGKSRIAPTFAALYDVDWIEHPAE